MGLEMMSVDPRQYCATCQHIRHVTEDGGGTYYLCSRLGWPTKPRWRFHCWVPRAPGVPMGRLFAVGDSDPEARK
jgi:hypothetical protein